MRKLKSIKFILVFFLAIVATPALAYVMSSTNYQIERDSINMGGGLSTSTSYSSESTMGEIGTSYLATTTYDLYAGYQQMSTTSISTTIPGAEVMTATISVDDGGVADASADIGVFTNNSLGYTLQIKSSTSPALIFGSSSFADYTPSGSDPDYNWSVLSSDSEFGFTPEGNDIVARYKDNGSSCNQVAGSDTASRCWDPLSTSYITVSQSSAQNIPSGTETVLKFRAEAGALASQPAGTYLATIIFLVYAN